MATPANPSINNPQIVGNAFVQQYYNILHHHPEEAHKFYHDSSVISRPGADGVMISVTTMKGINDKILSFNYKNYKVEIHSVDSQLCYMNGGVIVLVNGCLTGSDNVSRKFTQVFFLVPQDGSSSYYVLNDLFSYVNNDVDERVASTASLTTPDPEPTHAANHPVLKVTNDVKEVTKTAPKIEEVTLKKTYASVVHALKESIAPFMVRVPPPKLVEEPRKVTAAAPEAASVPSSNNNAMERKNNPTVKGHSIFVGNLAMDTTTDQLVEIFKQFGAIKSNGIQIVRRRTEGKCFGFVEFEHASSVQGVLEASSIKIGNRKAYIAEKRENNDGSRFPTARSTYRNFNEARDYRRNEFKKKSEGQAQGNAESINGKGRVVRQGQDQDQNQGGRKI